MDNKAHGYVCFVSMNAQKPVTGAGWTESILFGYHRQ